ncbi:glycosyltransferase family 4 protein [Saccharata proteae CBS 121410]|uniref:Glycosyltransferase family 4 protein n=1 Tax=Saccharata proteae CBS 121410 TaxID=1314787 RepID=A0A6A5YC32_9PEZI|nr:glycosyltransferase family 4 protein [Saccharata proteae CBS 121410]
MAHILKISVVGFQLEASAWWEWVLLATLVFSLTVGLASLLWAVTRTVWRNCKRNKRSQSSLPKAVLAKFDSLTNHSVPLRTKTRVISKPASFGPYLGAFSNPPTSDESRILSQWDLVILDPLQNGVLQALRQSKVERHNDVLGRIDIGHHLGNIESRGTLHTLESLQRIISLIEESFAPPGYDNLFTGILLAEWVNIVSVAFLNELVRYLAHAGLDVYLEIVPPDFLDNMEMPQLESLAGLVIKNGTVLPNGERRDFFQLDKMKSTTKAFVSQACLRPFTVMIWDDIKEDAQLSHAVMKRSSTWCSYHGALNWIGTPAAIMRPDMAYPPSEPIAAFQWLKDAKVMRVHEKHRSSLILASQCSDNLQIHKHLQVLFPCLGAVQSSATTTVTSSDVSISESGTACSSGRTSLGPSTKSTGEENAIPELVSLLKSCHGDPLSSSPTGLQCDNLGCFAIGFDATAEQFHAVLNAQRRLRTMNLLRQVAPDTIREIRTQLHHLNAIIDSSPHISQTTQMAVADFEELLTLNSPFYEIDDVIKVYLGLDSGFHAPNESQFWAVWEQEPSGCTIVYVSQLARDLVSTVIHCYLSSRSVSREQCFQTEFALSQIRGEQGLPQRFQQDLDLLSTTESILFLQHLDSSPWDRSCPMKTSVRSGIESRLLDVPTFKQLGRLSNVEYLLGQSSSIDLIHARTKWYAQQQCMHLPEPLALQIFEEVDTVFQDILWSQRHEDMDLLTSAFEKICANEIDCISDLLLFSVFCAAKKAAFEEIYLEVTDRNPLFNEYPDQGAAFAELFALGSRCESYFGVTPSQFGVLLSTKHRAYYNQPQNQPPMWIDNAPAFASAYAAAQTDIDPDQKPVSLPGYRRFTFLSVFAIPALVDIMLLTTMGRGLYLSAFMSEDEQRFATLGLMISLLLSGAIGTWISIGGTYYLISMAFSAANMFILTRLIGGLALTVVAAAAGFIVIAAVESVQSAAIFFFYLVGLTAYLSVLAALSTYQSPGSSFLNGRYVIILLVPILFISPIITTWVTGQDTKIYLGILYVFICALIIGTRWVGTRWVSWCNNITKVDDQKVKEWFVRERANGNQDAFKSLRGPAALALACRELFDQVMTERTRRFWTRSSADGLVKSLAASWDSTIFLLDWYCRTSDVRRPLPYSSTWNLSVQVANDSLLQAQKGIRLHNSFVHWRTAGYEIGCGILYFLVALLDRWVTLVTGGTLIGLSPSLNTTSRVSVGFGLAYYLIGAVLLDYKAQHLHQVVQQVSPISIKSRAMIDDAVRRDAESRRLMYWKTLARFLAVHTWTLALTTALLWVFDGSRFGLIMFMSYVGAYSGLLLYQYNKIFSGPHALMPLLSAVVLGFAVGLALKITLPNFIWTNPIALATATWTAAALSFRTAKVGMPPKPKVSEPQRRKVLRAYGGSDEDHHWSQSELDAMLQGLNVQSKESSLEIRPAAHPGIEIKAILSSCNEDNLSKQALKAFPNLGSTIAKIVADWEDGRIQIRLVSMKTLTGLTDSINALSCYSGGRLELYIASDMELESLGFHKISSNCQVVAELLLTTYAETILNLSNDDAKTAGFLPALRLSQEGELAVAEHVKRSMQSETAASDTMMSVPLLRNHLLRHLCLGVDVDLDWGKLPVEVRQFMLDRCLGKDPTSSSKILQWLEDNRGSHEAVQAAIPRHDLGAYLAIEQFKYSISLISVGPIEKAYRQLAANLEEIDESSSEHTADFTMAIYTTYIKAPFSYIYHATGLWIKFLFLAPMADAEYQRELDCTLSGCSVIFRKPAVLFLTCIWIYAKWVQSWSFPFFIYHTRKDIRTIWETIQGTRITLRKGRVEVKSLEKTSTAFIHQERNGGFKLHAYSGAIKTEPDAKGGLQTVCVYSNQMQLYSREEYNNKGELVNHYVYDYPTLKRRQTVLSRSRARIPLSRTCVRGKDESAFVNYNDKGHIESGSYLSHGNLVRFKYHYRKNAKYDDELLRAEFVLPHMSCNVSWSAPPVRHPEKTERWIPYSRVSEATFVRDTDVWECVWIWNHNFHPTIVTKLNGHAVETPDMIRHDWLQVLKKPTNCSFRSEDSLLDFTSVHSNILTRALHLNSKCLPVSTSQARSQLWRAWKKRNDIDGVVVRYLDERILRQEPLLKPYWRRRDRGNLLKAEDYLALNADAVSASAELSKDISAWTPLAHKVSDLFSFGPAGDAVVFTRTKTLQPDTEDSLHVVAVDTGTWPNEGGGVSACRRDLINNLKSIKWHMIAETANDFGLPKHQTEENVESLKVVPLWGLDFMHPVHGMFFNKLDSEVDKVTKGASDDDIRRNFVPTLTALIKGARAIELSPADIKQATRALCNLNSYFQDSRHWKEVWTSNVAKECWRDMWLADDIPNARPPNEWFETETPTLGHLDMALDLWFRYLFILSIPIPDRIPAVFQASHHSVSAAYGVICKIKRGSTLQIWDHAISWRETNLYLSSAMCTMPPFIRNALLALLRLTSVLILHHADQVLPCADFFNPGWEVEIGTCQGTIEHRNTFKRKVDPVVNGIPDMEKFAPIKEIKTKKPTVTMLSHVWFAKDIKTAILAADIIVNEWGFKDYNLDIYGALNKSPVYSSECQEILACKGVGENVKMKGTADPSMVLASTWVFLNSSVSEGLPLALGEAALTGAPVVCTDVGASLRVLTDPEDGQRYSEVVAPNDAYSLARAQINLLAMIDQWAKFADDDPSTPAPVLPIKPTAHDVQVISRRMYEKTKQRQKLGMMARDIVHKSFSGERYLREHEQMLWIGKSSYEASGRASNHIPEAEPPKLSSKEKARYRRLASDRYSEVIDQQLEKMAHPRPAWLKHASTTSSFSSINHDRATAGTPLLRDTSPPPANVPKVNVTPPRPGLGALQFTGESSEGYRSPPGHSRQSSYRKSMLSSVQNMGPQ